LTIFNLTKRILLLLRNFLAIYRKEYKVVG
jgi:hypothetical protein